MEKRIDSEKCLAILVFRTLGCSQDEVASNVCCAKLTVVEAEQWIRTCALNEAVAFCDDQAIKRLVGREFPSLKEISHELLVKAGQLTGDDILRHYRRDYLHIKAKLEQDEKQEFLALLQRWREQAQFLSPDELLRRFGLGALREDLLRHMTDSQPVAKIYDAAKRHHAQSIPGPVKVLLGVEQEGLFHRLRQCLPDDPAWRVQDDWALAYGAYLEAFGSWSGDVECDVRRYLALALGEELRERGHEVPAGTDLLEQLKKEDISWAIYLKLAGLVVSCDILTLGIEELPSNLLWFVQVDKLRILRSEAVNESTKLPKDFWLTQGDIGVMARLLWDHEPAIQEDTRNLLQKLQRVQAAQDDLHTKLMALECRLYNVAESPLP